MRLKPQEEADLLFYKASKLEEENTQLRSDLQTLLVNRREVHMGSLTVKIGTVLTPTQAAAMVKRAWPKLVNAPSGTVDDN